MSKYHAKKTTVDGIRFDSRKEAGRYRQLKLLERSGVIKGLELQVPYEIIPAFKHPFFSRKQAATKYVADFRYLESNGEKWRVIVEDVKGVRTPVYVLKRKLLLSQHGEDEFVFRET